MTMFTYSQQFQVFPRGCGDDRRLHHQGLPRIGLGSGKTTQVSGTYDRYRLLILQDSFVTMSTISAMMIHQRLSVDCTQSPHTQASSNGTALPAALPGKNYRTTQHCWTEEPDCRAVPLQMFGCWPRIGVVLRLLDQAVACRDSHTVAGGPLGPNRASPVVLSPASSFPAPVVLLRGRKNKSPSLSRQPRQVWRR